VRSGKRQEGKGRRKVAGVSADNVALLVSGSGKVKVQRAGWTAWRMGPRVA
jgi:hypothetical protein